jgi:hypothetical protein
MGRFPIWKLLPHLVDSWHVLRYYPEQLRSCCSRPALKSNASLPSVLTCHALFDDRRNCCRLVYRFQMIAVLPDHGRSMATNRSAVLLFEATAIIYSCRHLFGCEATIPQAFDAYQTWRFYLGQLDTATHAGCTPQLLHYKTLIRQKIETAQV